MVVLSCVILVKFCPVQSFRLAAGSLALVDVLRVFALYISRTCYSIEVLFEYYESG
jgi:hypothetical protein